MISEWLRQLLDAKIEQQTQDPSIKTQEIQPICGRTNCTIVSSLSFLYAMLHHNLYIQQSTHLSNFSLRI